jgi:hypothetical protein
MVKEFVEGFLPEEIIVTCFCTRIALAIISVTGCKCHQSDMRFHLNGCGLHEDHCHTIQCGAGSVVACRTERVLHLIRKP